jgi:adenylate cyclase
MEHIFKNRARQLQEAESRFRSVMETANDAIISINSDGNITSWNKAAEKMFGYPEEEVLNKPLTRIIPERYREAHEKGIERVNATGETRVIGSTVELSGLRKDGTEFPIELSLATWTIDEKRFFSGIVRDISERKEAERAVQEANQELEIKNEQLEGLSAKLAKYLSHQVYESIFTGKREVKIESYRKKLTVFFSDIQGFSELTDRMEAEELCSLLNNYLDEMSEIALRYGGTIDKFIGDGIMIFFGDPETKGEKEDALACVLMALEMRSHLKTLQKKWSARGVSNRLNVRMGINTGFCTVGNFGSENRLDYTIVGGQVNIASRLESIAEPGQILISHETFALVKDKVTCEPLGKIKVKGIAHPVQTYQVLDPHESSRRKKTRLMEEFEGFSLSIDLNTISQADKTRVLNSLETALSIIRDKKKTKRPVTP